MLTYPGQEALARAAELAAKFPKDPGAVSDADHPAFADNVLRCAAACCSAAERGLNLADRREALAIWSRAVDVERVSLGSDGAVPSNVASMQLDQFNKSGLLDATALLDAGALERAAASIDWLTAQLVASYSDAATACRLGDDLIEKLPLFPEATADARIDRSDTKCEAARVYAVAQGLLAGATDPKRIARTQRTTLLDHVLRGHHREQMGPEDRARLVELERIDAGLDQEFGEMYVHGWKSAAGAVAGAVLRVFSTHATNKMVAAEEELSRRKGTGVERRRDVREACLHRRVRDVC